MPIREAFRQLEAEGLVVFNPHRGVVVSEMSVDEVEELFDLRLLLETDLILRASQLATELDHARARDILVRSQKAYEDGDVEHWGELNWAFHAALYAPAKRAKSLQLLDGLNSNIDRYVRLQLSLEDSAPSRAHDDHSKVMDAYIARDGARLAAELEAHIRHARDKLLEHLRQRPEFAPDAAAD